MGLERQLQEASNDPMLVADCEFLADAGYLTEVPEESYKLGDLGLEHLARESHRNDARPETARPGLFISMLRHPSAQIYTDGRFPSGGEMAVAKLLTQLGIPTVPVMDLILSPRDLYVLNVYLNLTGEDADETQDGIVELVLKALPLPSDDIPLDAILAFTSDDETRRRAGRLDIWMRRQAQSGTDLQDVALELEESLHEFTSYMRLADMRHKTSTVRVLIALPLGVIEELVHLRPKGVLDVVFEYRDRKATRLEAELSAPGGALAYVYEAERRFGS